MWFIGVEVEQETSAPPPKKNPGSALQMPNKRRRMSRISFSLSQLECGVQEINSREIHLHLPFSANWNKRDKD